MRNSEIKETIGGDKKKKCIERIVKEIELHTSLYGDRRTVIRGVRRTVIIREDSETKNLEIVDTLIYLISPKSYLKRFINFCLNFPYYLERKANSKKSVRIECECISDKVDRLL